MGYHLECKYCDNPMPPANMDGDLVCSRCGAEWADAKILIHTIDEEDDAIIAELNAMNDEDWNDEDDLWLNDYSHEDEIEEDYDDYDELYAMEQKANKEWELKGNNS